MKSQYTTTDRNLWANNILSYQLCSFTYSITCSNFYYHALESWGGEGDFNWSRKDKARAKSLKYIQFTIKDHRLVLKLC